MNLGEPCKRCKRGKVRPFHFSLHEAIVRCDNPKCELDCFPQDCIINKTIRLRARSYKQLSSGSSHYLSGSSSSSSSGILSDILSPWQSPTPTPQDFQNRLSKTTRIGRQRQALDPRNNESETPNATDSLFDLLNNFNFNSAVPEEKSPKPAEPCVTGSDYDDILTSDLESWKQPEDLDILPKSRELSVDTKVVKDESLSVPQFCAEEGSLFLDAVDNILSGDTILSKAIENSSPGHTQELDNSGEQNGSNLDIMNDGYMHFMSPAASAASDDSGYTDEVVRKEAIPPMGQGVNFEDLLIDTLDKAVETKLNSVVDNLKSLGHEELEVTAAADHLNFSVHPVMVTVDEVQLKKEQEDDEERKEDMSNSELGNECSSEVVDSPRTEPPSLSSGVKREVIVGNSSQNGSVPPELLDGQLNDDPNFMHDNVNQCIDGETSTELGIETNRGKRKRGRGRGVGRGASEETTRKRGSRRGRGRGKVTTTEGITPRQTRQRVGVIEVQAPRHTADVEESEGCIRSGISSLLHSSSWQAEDEKRNHNLSNLRLRRLLSDGGVKTIKQWMAGWIAPFSSRLLS